MPSKTQVLVKFINAEGKPVSRWRPIAEVEQAIEEGFAQELRSGVKYRVFPLMDAEGQTIRNTDWREGSMLVKEGYARIVKTKRGPALAIGQVRPNMRTSVSREHISHETKTNIARVYAHRFKPGMDPRYFG